MARVKIEELGEQLLVASGQMTMSKQELDQERFWAIGVEVKTARKTRSAIELAIVADREEYADLFGHKDDHSRLRTRTRRGRR